MTPKDRLRVGIASARYLEALEGDDIATLESLWAAAGSDPELLAAFREVHAGLVEEQEQESAGRVVQRVAYAAEAHLAGGDVVGSSGGPLTTADVADELYRRPPDRLPAQAHQLNERLRAARDPLPEEMGLSDLVAWAEQKYGAAPAAYWEAFRVAAIKLELRRAAEVEFQLAARRVTKLGEGER